MIFLLNVKKIVSNSIGDHRRSPEHAEKGSSKDHRRENFFAIRIENRALRSKLLTQTGYLLINEAEATVCPFV